MTALRLVLLLSLICGPAAAVMHKEAIEYKDGEVTLRGYLYWDDAFTGKRPGVMVVHEWWGLNDFARLRAEMLAESGYVAFAADMYGEARMTRKPEEAKAWRDSLIADPSTWQRRAALGLQQLAAHENVDADRLAAIGYSLGAATVMQLAYTGADLRGAISFYGPLTPAQIEQGKEIKARVLVAHGDNDPFVSEDQMLAFRKSLSAAGVDWEMNIYAGAAHGFANPYADGFGMEGLAYQEAADRRSWLRTLGFLRDIFEEEI